MSISFGFWSRLLTFTLLSLFPSHCLSLFTCLPVRLDCSTCYPISVPWIAHKKCSNYCLHSWLSVVCGNLFISRALRFVFLLLLATKLPEKGTGSRTCICHGSHILVASCQDKLTAKRVAVLADFPSENISMCFAFYTDDILSTKSRHSHLCLSLFPLSTHSPNYFYLCKPNETRDRRKALKAKTLTAHNYKYSTCTCPYCVYA